MNSLRDIKEFYRIGVGIYHDFLFKITKNEKYMTNWETPFYTDDAVLVTPLNGSLPFYLYVPFNQEKGNEYFIVADGYNTTRCTKASKLSFYRPEYFRRGISTGKKKWLLNGKEKDNLAKFLQDTSYWATSGRAWFNEMAVDYNTALSAIEIPENLSMPDYTKLPEN